MFIGYICQENENTVNRKVKNVVGKSYMFTLIDKKLSDEQVSALEPGFWVMKTERELIDRKGNKFRTCTPIRLISNEADIYGYRGIWEALPVIFPEDNGLECTKGEATMLKSRIAFHSGYTENTIDQVRERLISGEITIDDIGGWINQETPINWEKAKMMLQTWNLRDGEVVRSVPFSDLLTHEYEHLTVYAGSLPAYQEIIPDYLRLTKRGKLIKVEVRLDKVGMQMENLGSFYTNALDKLQKTGAFWMTIAPYADEPEETFELGIGKESAPFQDFLKILNVQIR